MSVLVAAAGIESADFADSSRVIVLAVLVHIGKSEFVVEWVMDMFEIAEQEAVMLEVAYRTDSNFEVELVDFVQMVGQWKTVAIAKEPSQKDYCFHMPCFAFELAADLGRDLQTCLAQTRESSAVAVRMDCFPSTDLTSAEVVGRRDLMWQKWARRYSHIVVDNSLLAES